MTTTALPRASALWLAHLDDEESPAARRRRERWLSVLKAVGVVLLLAAVAV